MGKIAVVYWSGTGNTEEMAKQVAEGAKAAGAEAAIFTAKDFSADSLDAFDGFAFGCPSMGDEILEEDEFQPMWDCVEPKLRGRKVALFGSYDWGADPGKWMRDWEESCKKVGAVMACGFVICQLAPGDEAKAACQALGKALA